MTDATVTETEHQQTTTPTTIHLITHNHWDREWIFTARYTNRWLKPFFDNLFEMLEKEPEYRFVLDGQTLIIEDYLSQLSPDEAAAAERDIRRFAGEGRLLVGPAYLQPDWSLVSGEALVRNLLIGNRMAARYGDVMRAGWLLDNFGQIAQTPQIFKGFGIKGAFVWRGVDMPPENLKTEFWWEAPDGSRVLGIYLLDSYRNAMVLAMTRSIAVERVHSHSQMLTHFATTPNVLLMNGYEQVPSPDDVLPIIEEVNQRLAPDFHAKQSTPPEYLDAVLSQNPDIPTIKGYMYSGRYAPILKGVYSSRIGLNQQNNACQLELERWAEPFNTVAWAFGQDYPETRFESAWKTLLLNHTHDDVCGCCIDPIARDMEYRFNAVHRSARVMSSESLVAIAKTIDTSHEGTALVIFNPASRARSQVVGFSLELPEDTNGFYIQDGNGKNIPYQVISRIGNKLDLYLFTEDVPPVGYRTYYLLPGEKPVDEHPTVTASAEARSMENAHIKVTINDDGTLKVYDKQRHAVYDGLGYFEDGGDAGDTYDYSYPENDQIITSRGRKAEIKLVEAGPLVARFQVTLTLDLPRSLNAERTARSEETVTFPIVQLIELTADARHVEVKATINNVVKDHRLRVHFPTDINSDVSHAGEPFDVATFPLRAHEYSRDIPPEVQSLMLAGRYTAPVNTYPFQHFITMKDNTHGVTVFSRGLAEYEAFEERGTIALTLVRSVGWLARGDLLTREGDVGPHIFTPEAQCLGVQHFYYGIYPHGPDMLQAAPAFQADSHDLHLRGVVTEAHPGQLPDEFSFFQWVDEEPVGALKLSAVKQGEDRQSLILRLYNTTDQTVSAGIRMGTEVEQAWRANLNEETEKELSIEDDVVHVTVRGKEIVTLKLWLKAETLINDFQTYDARVVYPIEAEADLPPILTPPLITPSEVEAEFERASRLDAELQSIRSEAFVISEELELDGKPDVERLADLQHLKAREATLTRMHYESRISALLNHQLLVTHEIEEELDEIGEAVSKARVRKRVGEFLSHYYENLRRQVNGENNA